MQGMFWQSYAKYLKVKETMCLLNQACAWFLEIDLVPIFAAAQQNSWKD